MDLKIYLVLARVERPRGREKHAVNFWVGFYVLISFFLVGENCSDLRVLCLALKSAVYICC